MQILEKQARENARSYALRVLKYNIINLELPPGSAISENELSSALQLSRTPVREALIELNKLGLVEILPQRGSYISKINYDIIEESKFVRLLLEKAILSLACQDISEEYLAKLKANLEEMKQYDNSSNHQLFLECDNQFHKLIFQSVGKLWTYELIRTQMIHFDRLRTLQVKSLKNSKTIEDHENIVYAIERHDAELGEMMITRHLTRHQFEKSELLKLYPDYFTP